MTEKRFSSGHTWWFVLSCRRGFYGLSIWWSVIPIKFNVAPWNEKIQDTIFCGWLFFNNVWTNRG